MVAFGRLHLKFAAVFLFGNDRSHDTLSFAQKEQFSWPERQHRRSTAIVMQARYAILRLNPASNLHQVGATSAVENR